MKKIEWYYDCIAKEIFRSIPPNNFGYIQRVSYDQKDKRFLWLREDKGDFYKLRQPNEITYPLVVAEMNVQMNDWKIGDHNSLTTVPAINTYCFKRKKKRDDKYYADRLQKHKSLAHG